MMMMLTIDNEGHIDDSKIYDNGDDDDDDEGEYKKNYAEKEDKDKDEEEKDEDEGGPVSGSHQLRRVEIPLTPISIHSALPALLHCTALYYITLHCTLHCIGFYKEVSKDLRSNIHDPKHNVFFTALSHQTYYLTLLYSTLLSSSLV